MVRLRAVCEYLESIAPLGLAEDWDNVGLLVGDLDRSISSVMTCLTVTPESAAEAVQKGADLVITHHPLPLRPLKRITSDATVGKLLLQLIESRVAIFSAHTAFDSALEGINQQLAASLGLGDIRPLIPQSTVSPAVGSGRFGRLPAPRTVGACVEGLKRFLQVTRVGIVGDAEREVQTIAVACGSAGQFVKDAAEQGCDLLVLGETSFHVCLEAAAQGVALVLTGHYSSERFAVDHLARRLTSDFSDLSVWASVSERDPIVWL